MTVDHNAKLAKQSEAKAILTNYHALVERQYVGDTDAICTLLDFATAVKDARLTDRQAEALRLVYGEGMTQKNAGESMGIKQPSVNSLLRAAEHLITSEIDRKGRAR